MPDIVVNRKTGEIEIEGDCGAQWEGSCSKIKVSKDKIILECDTELVEECEVMRKERAREINERAEASSSGPMDIIPSKYKYFINYLDPEDDEGIRERYWYFIYLPTAEEFRDDLAEFWGDDPKSIKIQKVKHNPGGPGPKITWEYNRFGHVEIWKGTEMSGESDLYMQTDYDVGHFFYMIGLSSDPEQIGAPEDIGIGDWDTAEDPGYFNNPGGSRPQDPDVILARELALYAINDSQIYRQRIIPFIKNYARKKRKGIFDKKKAIEGLANLLAKDVQKKYWEETLGTPPPDMDQATKIAFGEELLDDMMETIEEEVTKKHRLGGFPDLTKAGEQWTQREWIGACGITSYYISDNYDMDILIGNHSDFGTHYWNIKNNQWYDFSQYPKGIIPKEDLHKYEKWEIIKAKDRDDIITDICPGVFGAEERTICFDEVYDLFIRLAEKIHPFDTPGGSVCPPGQEETDGFCSDRIVDPEEFDKRSFRTTCPKCPGGECDRCEELGIELDDTPHLVIGCPKGEYDPKTDVCKTSTRGQTILRPKSHVSRYGPKAD